MAFRFGSRLVTNRPLTDYLREVVRHFQVIELQTDPRYFSPNFSFTINEKKALRIYQEQYGFFFTMHAPYVNLRLGAINIEERQISINIILNAMRLTSDLGIKTFTFHPCTIEPQAPEKYPENCLYEEGSISLLLNEAKKLGITLLIENMPLLPEYHPKTTDGSRFQELLWLFPDPEFGLTLDLGHALQAGVSLESLLKMERIQHFHFHENDRHADLHLSVNTNLDWWSKSLKTIAKQFPNAVGILEMNRLEDQIESLNRLAPPSKKATRPKPQSNRLIPPLLDLDE